MSLREACNLAWHFLTKDGTKKGIDKLRADLIKPLPGETETVSDEVVAGELAMFQTALAAGGQQHKQGKK